MPRQTRDRQRLLGFLAFTFVGELLFLHWLRIRGADVERWQQRALAPDRARARPNQRLKLAAPRLRRIPLGSRALLLEFCEREYRERERCVGRCGTRGQ